MTHNPSMTSVSHISSPQSAPNSLSPTRSRNRHVTPAVRGPEPVMALPTPASTPTPTPVTTLSKTSNANASTYTPVPSASQSNNVPNPLPFPDVNSGLCQQSDVGHDQLDSTTLFLKEVDEWLVRIHKRVAELESRHRRHISVSKEGWWTPAPAEPTLGVAHAESEHRGNGVKLGGQETSDMGKDAGTNGKSVTEPLRIKQRPQK